MSCYALRAHTPRACDWAASRQGVRGARPRLYFARTRPRLYAVDAPVHYVTESILRSVISRLQRAARVKRRREAVLLSLSDSRTRDPRTGSCSRVTSVWHKAYAALARAAGQGAQPSCMTQRAGRWTWWRRTGDAAASWKCACRHRHRTCTAQRLAGVRRRRRVAPARGRDGGRAVRKHSLAPGAQGSCRTARPPPWPAAVLTCNSFGNTPLRNGNVQQRSGSAQPSLSLSNAHIQSSLLFRRSLQCPRFAGAAFVVHKRIPQSGTGDSSMYK